MLVSHGYRFIYTKTRKTAGTSVESYFEPFCMRDGEWSQRHFREEREEYVSPAGIIGYRSTWSERRARARHRGLVGPRDRTGLSRIQTVEAGAACWWNHMPAWLIREQLGDEIWKGYSKFCVIRHPFEKAISAYYHSKRLTTIRRGGRLELWNEDDPQQFEAWLERSPHQPTETSSASTIGSRSTTSSATRTFCRTWSASAKTLVCPGSRCGFPR